MGLIKPKKYSNFPSSISAGSNHLFNVSEERTVPMIVENNTNKPSKIIEVQSLIGGSCRISFSLRLSEAQYGEVQIYVNGEPKGIKRTIQDKYPITFTEDITIQANDVIQIYGKPNSSMTTLYIKDILIGVAEEASPYIKILKR